MTDTLRYQRPWFVEGLWIAPKPDGGHRTVTANTGDSLDGRLHEEYADNALLVEEALGAAPVHLAGVTADRADSDGMVQCYWPSHDPMMRLSTEDLHYFQLSLRAARAAAPPPTTPDEDSPAERRPRMVSPYRGANAAPAAMAGLARFAKLDGSQTAQAFTEWRRTQPPEFRPPSLPTIRATWPGVKWSDLLTVASLEWPTETKVGIANDLARAARDAPDESDAEPTQEPIAPESVAVEAAVAPIVEPEPETEDPQPEPAAEPEPTKRQRRRRSPTSTDHDAWLALRRWAASHPASYESDTYDAWAEEHNAPSARAVRRHLGRRWAEISVWVELEAARLLVQPDIPTLDLPSGRWWRRRR